MRIGSGLAGTEFTLFSWLGTASRTTNREGAFLFGSHGYIMQPCSATRWSILTSAFIQSPGIVARRGLRSAELVVSAFDQT